MYDNNFNFLSAEHRASIDFERALQRGSYRRFAIIFSRRSKGMPAFDSVKNRLTFGGQCDRGIQIVNIHDIVGSVGRSEDFDENFMPRKRHNEGRWRSIAIAKYRGKPLPPIELIKVGRFYFVEDGNHRISVASINGEEFMEAHITELIPPEDIRVTAVVEAVKGNDNRS